MAPAPTPSSALRPRTDEGDAVSVLLAKSVLCVGAAWAISDQPTALRVGLLGVAAFFTLLASVHARR